MNIDYTVLGQARITMLTYIKEILTTFEKEDPKWKGIKSSTAPNNIFVVNEDCKKQDQEKSWSSTI